VSLELRHLLKLMTLDLRKGNNVVVLPCGLQHNNLSSDLPFAVGAYPIAQCYFHQLIKSLRYTDLIACLDLKCSVQNQITYRTFKMYSACLVPFLHLQSSICGNAGRL